MIEFKAASDNLPGYINILVDNEVKGSIERTMFPGENTAVFVVELGGHKVYCADFDFATRYAVNYLHNH